MKLSSLFQFSTMDISVYFIPKSINNKVYILEMKLLGLILSKHFSGSEDTSSEESTFT